MLFISSKLTVQFFGKIAIRFMSFFGGCKKTQVVPFSFMFDASNVTIAAFVKAHTFVAGSVVLLWASVSVILRWSSYGH